MPLTASDEHLALQNIHSICTSTELYWRGGATEEEVWWGFSLFVTTVRCVCSFPASGSVLMPTHRHLPEIKTSWVCRVEQEEIETRGSGRVWGCRVKARRRLIRKRRERKRDLPLSLFCPELNSHAVLFLTLSNSFTTKKHSRKPACAATSHITLFVVLEYKGNTEVNLNDSGGHPPNTASLNLCLWCICNTGGNQQQWQEGNLPNHQSKLYE